MISTSEMRAAFRESLPVVVVVLPFGAVYGTVATAQGLSPAETMGFTAAVFAGASQLAALQMMAAGSPVWAVLISIFALNFRHVLYSASVGRLMTRFSPIEKALAFFLLVDPVFGAAEARALDRPLTKTFYFTYCLMIYVGWLIACYAGVVFGRLVDDQHAIGLDFILPVYFLTILMGFRSRRSFLPVVLVSGATAVVLFLTVGAPWHVTLGGLGGILYAAIFPPENKGAEEER